MGKVRAIKTDNYSYMCLTIGKGTDMVNIKNNKSQFVNCMHVKCIAHVVNLDVKECLDCLDCHVNQIPSPLPAIRSSAKRRDFYDETQHNLGLKISLLC